MIHFGLQASVGIWNIKRVQEKSKLNSFSQIVAELIRV